MVSQLASPVSCSNDKHLPHNSSSKSCPWSTVTGTRPGKQSHCLSTLHSDLYCVSSVNVCGCFWFGTTSTQTGAKPEEKSPMQPAAGGCVELSAVAILKPWNPSPGIVTSIVAEAARQRHFAFAIVVVSSSSSSCSSSSSSSRRRSRSSRIHSPCSERSGFD